ncbi:hypothetical protein [Rhodanobacter sp. MP7CTX1]|jgi:hypothetical protein|uniref:hypothetical protein n=1 Tax=Rhodanobacter sp. MP7CTX1 TaxID=2723084 RepID=UPI00161F53EF|nr:hypothetical protein [Rhodanobacter sp. MP7CTX1]MBB6185771.1 putative membrane protein [Rhodanobacter sp. MP7CTX1]
MDNDTKLLATLGITGAVIGLGKTLASSGPSNWKIALARCITTAGLSMSAALAVVIFPTLSFPAHVGLAAALASLGTTALESLFARFLGGGSGSK